MLECVKNLRQKNEKTEECIKEKENQLKLFFNKLESIYQKNAVLVVNLVIIR
jgi:hypothetical protein